MSRTVWFSIQCIKKRGRFQKMLADGQYMVWFIADVGGRIPESSVPLVCLLSTKRYVLYRLLVPFIFFIPDIVNSPSFGIKTLLKHKKEFISIFVLTSLSNRLFSQYRGPRTVQYCLARTFCTISSITVLFRM